MKTINKPAIVAIAMGLMVLTGVQGSAPDRIGSYDFSYSATGDSRARPAQVFDDGKSTYFQFRAGEGIPAIFAETVSGPALMLQNTEGPYIRVPAVAGTFVLRMGYGVGRVLYLGSGRAVADPERSNVPSTGSPPASASIQDLPREMFDTPARISLETNSYATPLKGDKMEWTNPELSSQDYSVPFSAGSAVLSGPAIKIVRLLSSAMSGASRIVITGRDDSTFKEGLAEARAAAILEVLAATGIPRSNLHIKTTGELKTGPTKGGVVGASLVSYTIKPNSSAAVPKSAAPADGSRSATASGPVIPGSAETLRANEKWKVRASDLTVEAMLRRWGAASGWRVVSKNAPEIKIQGDAEFERPDYLQAADFVITQAKQAGYRIEANAYSNKVLVIQTKE